MLGGTNGEGDNGGLMSIFPFLYKLLAAVAVLLFVLALLMSIVDLLSFSVTEIIQKVKTTRPNYSYVIDDANEYKLLDYSSTYLTNEPYLVYLQNKVHNMAISVVGFAMIVFAFQVGIFLVLKIRAAVYKDPYDDSMKFDSIASSFVVLAIVFVGGIILTAVYKSFFQKTYQKAAIIVKQELRAIDTMIKNGMTTNAAFLGALRTHNMPIIYRIFKEYASNAKTTNNYKDLQSLFFTMSVFNYFDSISPAGSDSRTESMKLFSGNPKDIQPHALFFYQGTNNISNVFDIITKSANGQYRTEFSNIDPNKMIELSTQLDDTIKELNHALLKLKKPTKMKIDFLIYIIMYIIVAVAIFGVLVYVVIYQRNLEASTAKEPDMSGMPAKLSAESKQ